MSKKVIVIGAGFAGLSVATNLADKGYQVTILEKNNIPGGRARKFEAEGYTFDMGPSWYWMPDVFENYFKRFGKKLSDYYELKRLDPSYRVYFAENDFLDLPAGKQALHEAFESIEPGSGKKLAQFLEQASYKYQVGINELVYKPGRSIFEFTSLKLLYDMVRLDLFTSISKHVAKFFKHPKLVKLMEFPVLFLGATPQKTPALYSFMNYADMGLGTYYPTGGMHKIVEGMVKLAREKGVEIKLNHEVIDFPMINGAIKKVKTKSGDQFDTDIVVGGADYHHLETLMPENKRNYSEQYWENRTMAPSSILYYLGVNKKLKNLLHHNLFFDEDFKKHAEEIYDTKEWPSKPLFYVSVTSKTDTTAAPEGCENVFILIPTAPGLQGDNEAIREKYFNIVLDRLESLTQQDIRSHVVYKKSYAHSNFIEDYHAYKGNAYGLANTLKQTAILKPSLKSKKIKNLFFTGQLTVPGPGVPPSLISGIVVADQVAKEFKP
jgi:phytoene desaturase